MTNQLKKRLSSIFIKYIRSIYRLCTRTIVRCRLKNKDFTIITNTCIGGVIYHELGLQFKSPTINLWMHDVHFYKMVSNLKEYMAKELVFEDGDTPYPIAWLGDVQIHFNHYHSKEDARVKWEERKKRINYSNLFIIGSDAPLNGKKITHEDMLAFGKVPCKGKIIFSVREYKDVPYIIHLAKSNDGEWTNTYMLDRSPILGKWAWEDKFNYVQWLNNGN